MAENLSSPDWQATLNQMGGNFIDAVSPFYDKVKNAVAPKIADTTLGQSQYNFNSTVFPIDIGADYMGHYVVININVQMGSVFNGNTPGQAAGSFGNYFTTLANEYSKLDVLRFGGYTSVNGAPTSTFGAIPRNTRRIAESIALFMPTPVTFNGVNAYEEISLSALAGKAIGVAAQKLGPLATSGFGAVLGQALGGAQGAVVGGLTGFAAGTLGTVFGGSNLYDAISTVTKLAGSPINPAVEIIFANTVQRQFVMEWLLAPRNEAESVAAKKIIQTLRFHAAPEINPVLPFMWIPPAEFDITFYRQGVENTNLIRINTCVLERCEVQYDPTGVYSTFRNGHPVAIRLSLAFRELEPVHKQRVLQGF